MLDDPVGKWPLRVELTPCPLPQRTTGIGAKRAPGQRLDFNVRNDLLDPPAA
jgi:hypothetical protein